MKTTWILASIALFALAAPGATADSGSYLVGALVTGYCDPVGTGDDVGLVCELECGAACDVLVVDDVLGADVLYQVCDWDGEADVNCSDLVSGTYTHTSTTGVIDIFILGVKGTATATPL
jgi:hypothetical protein